MNNSNEPKWVNIKGESVPPPMYVGTVKEALEYLRSVYDENQTGKLPPTIGMPTNMMTLFAHVLSEESEKASKRTKEDLERSHRQDRCVCCWK